jgi:putative NADPH-quinone reductase
VTRALVVHCHPKPDSFTAAVRDRVMDRARAAGEARLRDLYAEGFDPRLTADDLDAYADPSRNAERIGRDVDDLRWCDALIFTYPTWSYGLPAMLKGWIDRVMVPGVAFHLPGEGQDIRPALTQVRGLGCFTTCGASRLLTALVGAPGRRTILRGMRAYTGRGTRSAYAAHYLMDSATPVSRAAHLDRVGRATDRLLVR